MSAPVRPVPTDIGTAFQLWWAVIGFGLVDLFASLVVQWSNRGEFADELAKDMRAGDPENPMAKLSPDALAAIGLGGLALFGLALATVVVFVVFQMRSGHLWARMVLTMIAVFLVVSAVPVLFGLGPENGGVAAALAGGAGIVGAVVAGGAVWLMHRRESNEYFVRAR